MPNNTMTTTAPTHKTCGVCHLSLPRHLFQKKEYRITDRSPTCHDCKRTLAANRMKQKPPSRRAKQGRVADSGLVRRPNNFGYCDYIDMLFGMKCFPDLISLGVFRSAKDVSESMAVLQGTTRHGNFVQEGKGGQDKEEKKRTSDILCLCIGDGNTPRTAMLACYLQGWTCTSIDPCLNEEWSGRNPKNVDGLTGYRGTLAQFFAEADTSLVRPSVRPASSSSPSPSSPSYKHLVLLCVHSHARFIGSVTVSRIRAHYGNIRTTICSLPCCPTFRHKGDVGREPDISYDDDCVFSAMRKVEIWNIEQGCDDADDADLTLCREVAETSVSSLLGQTIDSPSDLSPQIIADMMRSCPLYSECLPHNADSETNIVQSISIEEIEEGVLSHVVRVAIEYTPPFSNAPVPDGLVIKFQRPEAPQHRMFSTEGAFYFPANDALRKIIPFRLSKAIHVSPSCIALERVVGRSMKLSDGCQDWHDAEMCIKLLATMHAKSWVGCSDCDDDTSKYADLDPTPGVGLALDGLTKERRFASHCTEYLDLYANSDSEENAIVDEGAQGRLRSLCEQLRQYQLREVHDRVATYRPCLIHGDFHVANLIFSPNDGTPHHPDPPALIDWATCGRGNPLFDLVFFLIVSTPRGGEDHEYTDSLLKLYYCTLIDDDTSDNAEAIRRDFSTYDESFLRMYRNVVLNEFLILVAYDQLARQFVEAADKPAVRAERACHFRNVARRCVMALLAIEPSIDWPSLKSEDDWKDEEMALASGGGDNTEIAL
mmetsp:Transcript_33959/g.100074  ORF Transcript_33959/g.100074 Transcript_33959/m.100074 type:complete len:768 (+) Transcript_33959:136-2439(+)